MNRLLSIGLVGALVALGGPALGFQETTVAPSAPVATDDAARVGIAPIDPVDSGATVGVGTEVRIPGLGSLGVLPKLDFGLELLYGANEPTSAEDVTVGGDDELKIQGRIKHRF